MNHPLLDQLVDYAGLFPPASLDLEPAVEEYARHLGEVESWMLGRFIIPVTRLDELLPYSRHFSQKTLRVSVLPAKGHELAGRIRNAASRSDSFEESFSGNARVEIFEARVDSPEGRSGIEDAGKAAGTRALYLEWPFDDPGLQRCLEAVAEARSGGAVNLGAKLRCGGTVPEAYPPVEVVAHFIATCARLRLPFKATAGLHHPVRHEREGVIMHGFLNVFGASVLALTLGLDSLDVIPIIAEKDPAAFDLADGGFAWGDLRVTAEQVAVARNELAHAYGSCSFSEPREDLDEADWFGLTASTS